MPTTIPALTFEAYKAAILAQITDLFNGSKDGDAVIGSGHSKNDQMFAAAINELAKEGWFAIESTEKASFRLAASGNFWRNKRA